MITSDIIGVTETENKSDEKMETGLNGSYFSSDCNYCATLGSEVGPSPQSMRESERNYQRTMGIPQRLPVYSLLGSRVRDNRCAMLRKGNYRC